MSERPERNLALELVRVTEAAALAAGRFMGRGDKEGGDKAAVDAMRQMMSALTGFPRNAPSTERMIWLPSTPATMLAVSLRQTQALILGQCAAMPLTRVRPKPGPAPLNLVLPVL